MSASLVTHCCDNSHVHQQFEGDCDVVDNDCIVTNTFHFFYLLSGSQNSARGMAIDRPILRLAAKHAHSMLNRQQMKSFSTSDLTSKFYPCFQCNNIRYSMCRSSVCSRVRI